MITKDSASFGRKFRNTLQPVSKEIPVGTVHEWGDGPHKKVAPGDWEPVRVGITSARPEKTDPEAIRADMEEFSGKLKSISTVKDVDVVLGRGGWEGGSEPSWVVSYKGNGKARELLRETGRKFNQDSVLLYEPAKPGDPDASPLIDFDFGVKLTDEQMKEVEQQVTEQKTAGKQTIMGGWTWYHGEDGSSKLRLVHIPEYAVVGATEYADTAHVVMAGLMQQYRRIQMKKDAVKAHLMTREKDYV